VHNRGPEAAPIQILPQVWFRNIWAWSEDFGRPDMSEQSPGLVRASHDALGQFTLAFEAPDRLAFCDNDTNFLKVFGSAGPPGYYKDGIHDFIVHGQNDAINPEGRGSKVAGVYRRMVPSGQSTTVRVRLCADGTDAPDFEGFDRLFHRR